MYSVNVPVPQAVRSLAADLRPALSDFERIRQRPTLLCKRLPAENRREYLDAERRARRALDGLPPFAVRIDGIDVFEDPPSGTAPVVYLSVTSPGLDEAHRRLVDEFGAIDGLEGEDFVPHVTLARQYDGGPVYREDPTDRLRRKEIDPIEWDATELQFYDASYGERIDSVSLPA
ncbi:2'-5' RNA ligase family protein [Halospeciosus flavus]|uniref:2'-5' RNA ligase family protein n=1 Tax=Halospeciosus flavus TaxID=3032283 RepID=A0ABD5Z7D1_9EURY